MASLLLPAVFFGRTLKCDREMKRFYRTYLPGDLCWILAKENQIPVESPYSDTIFQMYLNMSHDIEDYREFLLWKEVTKEYFEK